MEAEKLFSYIQQLIFCASGEFSLAISFSAKAEKNSRQAEHDTGIIIQSNARTLKMTMNEIKMLVVMSASFPISELVFSIHDTRARR